MFLILIRKMMKRQYLMKVLKNSNWLFFDKIFRLITSLIVGVMLARYLGPKNFGLLNYSLAYVAIFSMLANLGLDAVVIKDLSTKERSQNQILGTTFLLKFSGAFLTLLLSFLIMFFYNSENHMLLLLTAIVSLGVFFQAFDAIDFYYQANFQSKNVVLFKGLPYLVINFVKLILIVNKAPLLFFACTAALEVFLGAIGLLISYRVDGFSVRKWSCSWFEAKRLLNESWPLFFSGFLVLIYIKIDQVMIGNMLGAEALGVYSVAVKLIEAWYFIPMVITTSVFPVLVNLRSNDIDGYYKLIQNLYLLMMWLSFTVAMTLTFSASFLISHVFGSQYSKAADVVVIQCWSGIFIFSGLVSNNWYLLEKLSHLNLYRHIVGVFLNVILNIYLIPIYGIVGGGFATLITQFFVSYLIDLFNVKTRSLFYIRTRIYLFFIPISYQMLRTFIRAEKGHSMERK